MLLSIDLDEVVELLLESSPFSHSSHQRLDQRLLTYVRNNNYLLKQKAQPREEFFKTCKVQVLCYQILANLLGIDVSKEREEYGKFMQEEYHLKDPLAVHFYQEYGEEESTEKLEDIIGLMKTEEILDDLTPSGMRKNAYRQARHELQSLEREYSIPQALKAFAYAFVLCPSVGWNVDSFKERYKKATDGHETYILLIPEPIIDEKDAQAF